MIELKRLGEAVQALPVIEEYFKALVDKGYLVGYSWEQVKPLFSALCATLQADRLAEHANERLAVARTEHELEQALAGAQGFDYSEILLALVELRHNSLQLKGIYQAILKELNNR